MLSLASKSTATGGSGDVTITKPTGLAEGDIMVAFISSAATGGSSETHSGPSGWTKLENQVISNGPILTVWAIKATSTETAASNFSWTSGGDNSDTVGAIFRITSTEGFATVADLVVSQSVDALTASGITTASATNILLLCATEETSSGVNFDYSGYTVANNDPTWTEEYDIAGDTGGVFTNMGIASADYNLMQATGTYSITTDSGGASDASAIVSIGEPVNVTVNAGVLTATSSLQSSTQSGGATVNAGILNATSSLPAPTITAQQNTVWTEETQPSTDWTNEQI